jgi:hypothetical protein
MKESLGRHLNTPLPPAGLLAQKLLALPRDVQGRMDQKFNKEGRSFEDFANESVIQDLLSPEAQERMNQVIADIHLHEKDDEERDRLSEQMAKEMMDLYR